MSASSARSTTEQARASWPALLLVLALLAAAAAGGGALFGLRGADTSRAETARLYEVVGLADDLLAALVDAETGQRGFLLTGEERYLEPHEAAEPRRRRDLERLRALAAPSGAQGARLARVEGLAAAKLAELDRTIALRRAGDAEGALAVVRTDEGKRTMDALRAALAEFEAEERAALADRLERAASRSRSAAALVAAGLLAALLLGAFAASGLLRAARDETTRAEAALGLREAQLRAVFEGAPIGLSVHDRALRFLGINGRLAAVNGLPPAAHLGRTISEVLPAPLGAEVEAAHRRVLESGEPLRELAFSGPGAAPGEAERHYLASYHPLRDPGTGEAGGVVAAVVEVTELRRAEGALRALNRELEARVERRTAELAEVAAELDAFAYTVSHDLRAPLRAIEGFARILEEEHGEALDAAGRRHARRVVEAAERLDGLIRDLLAYSRLSRAEIEARPVPLEEVVDRALADLPAGAAAEVSVERPLPPVLGARPVLNAMLGNLLSNALKFTEAGRRPRVRVRAEARPGGRVRLWVEDDGIGMAPEHLDRVFQVFERLHGQEHYPGTGIGLAIVRKGAERLGGAAGAESDGPGRGSRFWIELPGTAGA